MNNGIAAGDGGTRSDGATIIGKNVLDGGVGDPEDTDPPKKDEKQPGTTEADKILVPDEELADAYLEPPIEEPTNRKRRRKTRMQKPRVTWKTMAVLAVLSCMLAIIFTWAAANTDDPRSAMPMLLMSLSVCLLASAWLAARADGMDRPVRGLRLDRGGNLMVAGGLIVWLQLIARLMAVSQFGGDAANFDFGTKCSKDGVCGDNHAFADGDGCYHVGMGIIAFFLFPCRGLMIYRFAVCFPWIVEKRPDIAQELLALTEMQALGMVVYPILNCCRYGMFAFRTFASSSFCHNQSEWAAGFMGGLVLATLCASLAANEHNPEAWKLRPEQRPSSGTIPWVLAELRVLAGILLILSTLASSVLMALSWENKPEDTEDITQTANQSNRVLLFLTPVFILVVSCMFYFICPSMGFDDEDSDEGPEGTIEDKE